MHFSTETNAKTARKRDDEMHPNQRFMLRRSAGLLIAGVWLVGCGTPGPARDNAAPSQPAQAEEEECNVKEAARIVYGDPPPEQELNPGAARALCEKAEILLAEQEAIEEGQENPATPGDPPPLEADYYEEDEVGIFSEQEANEAPSNTYHYGNGWRGIVDDKNVTVSSGWEIKSPTFGIVELQVRDPYSGVRTLDKVIPAPIPGPLRIVSADNPKLEIKSEATGEVAVFDAAEQQWVKKDDRFLGAVYQASADGLG